MRKRTLASAVVGLLLFFAASPSRADVLWQDDFETNDFTAWTQATGAWRVVESPQSAHSGFRGGDITGPTIEPFGDVLLLRQSTLGFQNLELGYWFKIREAFEAADAVRVDWTANGQDWINLAFYSNVPADDWRSAFFSLPPAASDNPDFGLRFLAELGSGSDRLNLDDLELRGEMIPEPGTLALLIIGFLAARRQRVT